MPYYIKTILIIISFAPQWVAAQGCCTGGSPLTGNLGIQNLNAKYLQLQLLYDYNTQKSLIENTTILEDAGRERNTHSIMLRGSYAFNEKWSVSSLFSWVRQEERVQNVTTGEQLAAAEGIGDVIGLAQYKLFSKPNSHLVLAAGAKFPVGGTNRLDEQTGIPLNPDLQPGTGAWDGIAGLNYLRSGILRPTSVLTFYATYRLTFADNRYNSKQIYEFGDELQARLGLGDSFLNQWVEGSLIAQYRYTQRDKANDIPRINTGGHWLHLVPQLRINFLPNMNAVLSGEIPVYRNLKGFQLTTTYKIFVGLSYSFTT